LPQLAESHHDADHGLGSVGKIIFEWGHESRTGKKAGLSMGVDGQRKRGPSSRAQQLENLIWELPKPPTTGFLLPAKKM